jgi:ATP-dependent Clp protease adapter protein ClpS
MNTSTLLKLLTVFLMALSTAEAFTANLSRAIAPSSSSGGVVVGRGQQHRYTWLQAGGPAVAEPPAVVEETVEETTKKDAKEQSASYTKKGGWAVRLFNDPMNKREFVSMCLAKICGISDGQAYQVMMAAHQNGLAVIGRYDFERAELYRDSLVEHGLVCDMIPVEED